MRGFSPARWYARTYLQYTWISVSTDTIKFHFIVVLSGVLGSLLNLIPVMGEEMGWRGYMLTRLIDAEFSRPILISGLIWATWHVPIVIAGLYVEGTSALLSVLGIYFCIVPFSYITAYLRLITGSVWPSVIIHTTWNAIIQGLSHVQVQEIKLRFGLENRFDNRYYYLGYCNNYVSNRKFY